MKGISFIICSRDPGLLDELKKNINEKIDHLADYEIIAISNQNNAYSIASAYNKGIAAAKYNLLCFIHEDVRFITDDFGAILIKKFENPEIAAVGVAGSTLLPETGSWFSLARPFVQGQVVHKLPNKEQLDRYGVIRQDTDVVVLDGLFIVVRKEIAQSTKFDEETFDGFHFYDIDFTLRIAQKHKIIVTYDILLQHFSGGKFDESWTRYRERLIHKYKLPYTKLQNIPQQEGKWAACPYDSRKTYPKILVGCPTSFHKEYCLDEYARAIKSLTYPNYDILLIDNSLGEEYSKKIASYSLPVIKGPYLESARERIIASRNLLKQYAIDNNYEYLLSLEQDVIPPQDIIERMLVHDRQVITGIYFNRDNKQQLYPLAYVISNQPPNKLPDMRPLNQEELWRNIFFQIISAGLGCLLIHKDVLARITFRYEGEEPFDDRFFFLDLYNLKIKAFADTSIKCRHFILNRPYQWRDIKK